MKTNKEYLKEFIDSCDVNSYSTKHLNSTKKYTFGTDHIESFMKKQEEYMITEKKVNEYAAFCVMCDRDGRPLIEFKDYLKL